MGENKVVKMLIKVDLQCSKCYKKIKKLLCRFNEIRDQVYDEKANTVTITVVCCSPDKIKEKICCKGGNTILGIETIPDKPKQTEKPKETEKPKDKQKEPEKPNTKVVVIFQPPKEAPTKPKEEPPKTKPEPPKPKEDPKPPKPPQPICVCPGYPVPVCGPGVWGCPCSQGYGGGPYYGGYPRLPPMCSDGCGRPAYACADGCGRPAYVCQGGYFSDENPSGCMVM